MCLIGRIKIANKTKSFQNTYFYVSELSTSYLLYHLVADRGLTPPPPGPAKNRCYIDAFTHICSITSVQAVQTPHPRDPLQAVHPVDAGEPGHTHLSSVPFVSTSIKRIASDHCFYVSSSDNLYFQLNQLAL